MRRGQAMVESLIAILIITSAFIALFKLSRLLTGKILLEHAAMRVARARTVGLNEFMCRKAARVAVIPVAGRRLWPTDENQLDYTMELHRLPDYMASVDEPHARGILEYDLWDELSVDPSDGSPSRVSMDIEPFEGEDAYHVTGEARIEPNASLYMMDAGL